MAQMERGFEFASSLLQRKGNRKQPEGKAVREHRSGPVHCGTHQGIPGAIPMQRVGEILPDSRSIMVPADT